MTGNDWHLDKKIPITLILSLLLQTGAIIWVASAMNSKIEQNSERLIRLEAFDSTQRVITQNNTTAIAVINENLKNMRDSLARIEKAVEKGD